MAELFTGWNGARGERALREGEGSREGLVQRSFCWGYVVVGACWRCRCLLFDLGRGGNDLDVGRWERWTMDGSVGTILIGERFGRSLDEGHLPYSTRDVVVYVLGPLNFTMHSDGSLRHFIGCLARNKTFHRLFQIDHILFGKISP